MTVVQASKPTLPPCDHTAPTYRGADRETVLGDRQRFAHPALFALYAEPLMIVHGHMQYLWDHTGKRYLDGIAGIVTVSCGHGHPKIVERVKRQLDEVQHTTTIYLHPNLSEAAKKLASKMPEGLDVTYFCNSGSEANELAVAMARLYTGNEDILAVRNGYHGGTATAMGLTSHSTWKFGMPQGGRIHHVSCPDPYRSKFSGTPEEIAEQSVNELKELIQFTTPGKVAGFLAEPIQGVGGATHGAPNYLRMAYDVVREHCGLCIADEVQTGFGRTGDHYWGFENFGVVPDMVVMAKGIGNGFPIGAVTTRREIAEALTGRIHFNTFGGNPLCMAAASAVLDVIDEDGLQENSRVVGGRLKAGLQQLQTRHRQVGDVRGMGLMLGFELVKDRVTKEPAPAETAQLLESCREMGLLIGKGGYFGNVVRFKPPMCLTEEDAEFALAVIDESLSQIEAD
ncbi:MAG: aspartate aminotransferase family protein [Thermoanaerobaculia bacterium]|nr:aspartate aminotransferase family protein [Thermoanaerobaculia bacterium]